MAGMGILPVSPVSAAEPPPRTHAELDAALSPAELANPATRAVRITLVWGDKDHGANQHDYPRFQAEWSAMLATVKGVTVSTAKDRPTPEQWKTADMLICYLKPAWTDSDYAAMDAYLNRGGGMLFIHQAVAIAGGGAELARRLGLASNGSAFGGKYEEGPLDVNMSPTAHVITQGLAKSVHFDDEAYWLMLGDTASVQVLATTVKDGAARPMLWIHPQGKGMAIGSILGHNYWTFNDPLYRLVLLRSVAFALGERLGRFAPLVTQGLTLTGPTALRTSPADQRFLRERKTVRTVRMDGRRSPDRMGSPKAREKR